MCSSSIGLVLGAFGLAVNFGFAYAIFSVIEHFFWGHPDSLTECSCGGDAGVTRCRSDNCIVIGSGPVSPKGRPKGRSEVSRMPRAHQRPRRDETRAAFVAPRQLWVS